MQVLVVFESMFGNTEIVARAIGKGLATSCEVDVVNVDGARYPQERAAAGRRRRALVDRCTGMVERLAVGVATSPRRCLRHETPPCSMAYRLGRGRRAEVAAEAPRCAASPAGELFVDVSKNATILCDGVQERAEAWGTTLAARLMETAAG